MRAFLSSFVSACRFSLRSLSRQPAFALVAVVALGLGIGANTAIFSVIDGVLLQPLPFPDPDRLVRIQHAHSDGSRGGSHAYPDLMDVRDQNDVFTGVVAVRSFDATLTGSGPARRLRGAAVSEGLLDVLGVDPVLGRDLVAEEFDDEAAKSVLVSYSLWQSRFGGERTILGRTISLDGVPVTVVGVLPPGGVLEGYLRDIDLLGAIPRGIQDSRDSRYFEAYARLRDGVDLASADAELAGIFQRLEAEYPQSNMGHTACVQPLRDSIVGDVESALWILAGSVLVVLLIACANVANMLLARGAARRRETAIRTSLGAGRASIAALFLGEACVLASLGGLLGLALASWSTDLLLALAPDGLPLLGAVSIDSRALAATLGLVALTGLVSGLLPAWLLSRRDPRDGLAEGVRGGIERGGRLRSALVVAEIAASLVLLVAAGLLVRSFQALLDVDPGFESAGVAVFEMELPASRYESKDAVKQMYDRVMEALDALPQVVSAGSTLNLPYSETSISIDLWPVGTPLPLISEAPSASFHVVTEGYFDTLRMRLLEGRTFGREDDGEPRTIVVNRAYADKFWPGRDALGQRVMVNLHPDTTEEEAYEVIGIVDDVRQHGLDVVPAPEMYTPQRQFGVRFCYVVVRTEGDPALLEAPVRAAVAGLDPDLPVQLRTLDEMVGDSLARRRFVMSLLTVLGALALLLAAVGIYGVMAYSVSLRLREMSIRRALGARGRQILAGVLAHTLKLAGAGIVLGAAGAVALSGFLDSLLYGISATDPATYTALAAGLGCVAALAGLGPARRATQVDPMAILRQE